MFPLLLILPAAFLFSDNFKQRIKNVLIGFAPFVLTIVPFLGSTAFRQMVLFSPKSQKMLFMTWPVSGAEGVYPFIFILCLVYLLAFYRKGTKVLAYYFLAILLLIYSVTHYHPQWFLWVTPLFVIDLVRSKFANLLPLIVLFGCWLTLTLLFEPSLSYGMFYPLLPDLKHASGLTEILALYTDVFKLKSLVRSIFAASALFYAFDTFTRKIRLKAQ